jgi:hypothetical protein
MVNNLKFVRLRYSNQGILIQYCKKESHMDRWKVIPISINNDFNACNIYGIN